MFWHKNTSTYTLYNNMEVVILVQMIHCMYCGKQRGQKRLCHGTAHYAKRDLWWCSTTQGFNFAFATLSHNGHDLISEGTFLIS